MPPMSHLEGPLPLRQSLRAKAWLATFGLLAYMMGAGLYLAMERAEIRDSVVALERLAQHEKSLALTEAALAGALVDVSETSSAAHSTPGPVEEMRLYMETCSKLFADLERHDPSYAVLQRGIQRSYDQLQAVPVRANWIDLRESLKRAADELEIRHRTMAERREALMQDYGRHYDAMTVEALALSVLGLVAFGSLAAWFFAGLAHDIRRLQDHSLHILRGRRGHELRVHRDDELGRLMHAVNRMSAGLERQERQNQLELQRNSHQDKMLALGALAAGVAHEVNNPLTVISALVQELQAADDKTHPEEVARTAHQILEQVDRAAQSARQLAQLAAPQPADLDMVDINGILHQAVRLMGYDRRYRKLVYQLHLDPQLPAVRTSGGAIQQVIMQILTLVCQAVVEQHEASPHLKIITAPVKDGIEAQVLLPPAIDFTRSEVQRQLLLCRAIVEPLRGRLAFDQLEGPLQRVQLRLPIDHKGEEG